MAVDRPHSVRVPDSIRHALQRRRRDRQRFEQLANQFDEQDSAFRAAGGVRRLGRPVSEVLDVLVSNGPTVRQTQVAKSN